MDPAQVNYLSFSAVDVDGLSFRVFTSSLLSGGVSLPCMSSPHKLCLACFPW